MADPHVERHAALLLDTCPHVLKDLRHGGRIELDGRVVQQDGAWVV